MRPLQNADVKICCALGSPQPWRIPWGYQVAMLLLLAGCDGKPVHLPLARRLGIGAGQQRRLSADEARLYGDTSELMAYHADIEVGTPGQLLSVIVDTGSSQTAFPCSDCDNCGSHMDPPFSPSASSSFRWVGCGESGCSSCLNNSCSYTAKYVEGSSIEGKYFKDVLQLGVSERENDKSVVRMGCHTKETGLFKTQVPSGIMGLRDGHWNVLSQLADGHVHKKLFALCLAEHGGSFSMGEVNSTWMPTTGPWQWMPYTKAYYVDMDSVTVAGHNVFNEPLGSFLVDSGTTYTYFTSRQALALENQIRDFCKAGACGSAKMPTRSCYEVSDDDLDKFPDLHLSFGSANYTWQARGYLYRRSGNWWCYSFFGMPPLTLGASFMRNHAIVFDQDAKRIGFATSACPEFVTRAEPEARASVGVTKHGPSTSFLGQLNSAHQHAASLLVVLGALISSLAQVA